MDQNDTMRGIRVLRGMSRSQAAKAIGVSKQTIGSWERGDTEPTRQYLVSMAQAYHVSLDQLVGLTDVVTTKKALIS